MDFVEIPSVGEDAGLAQVLVSALVGVKLTTRMKGGWWVEVITTAGPFAVFRSEEGKDLAEAQECYQHWLAVISEYRHGE